MPSVLLFFYLLIPGLISSEGLWYVQLLAVFSFSLLPPVSFLLHTFGTAAFFLILAAFPLPEADREEWRETPANSLLVFTGLLGPELAWPEFPFQGRS